MMYSILVTILITTITLSNECPLHDAISMARSSTETSTTNIDQIHLNNQTISRIYQNVSDLLKKIDDGHSDSLLIHLNQTSTNSSTLALIVKNESEEKTSSKDSNQQQQRFRMYYVRLSEDPAATNGYRLYWKIFRETFRNQINFVMNRVVWSPVQSISKYWRPNSQQQNVDQQQQFKLPFTLPIIVHAIDLPESFEPKIIEIEEFDESTSTNSSSANITDKGDTNQSSVSGGNGGTQIIQQIAKKIFFRAITAFKGHLWAQLPSQINSSPSLRNIGNGNDGIGVFITDKGVRINLIGEQKPDGNIDWFVVDAKTSNKSSSSSS